MGDFGDFVKAGRMIWGETDPYSNLMYVNSPVSAVLAYGLSRVFPFLFFPLFWQLLNIVGLAMFIKSVVKQELHRALPLVIACFALLNVTRALFANVQVTGLVLGLIALSINAVKNNRSIYLVVLPAWLALEVKPQLAFGFVALILFQNQIQKFRILLLGFFTISSHLFVELKFSGDINYLWIRKVLAYSSASLKEGYEISYWKAIAIYSGHTSAIRIISTLLLVGALGLIIFLALKGRFDWALFIAMILPFQNTYLHLYDLAPLGVLVLLALYKFRNIALIATLCIFLQIFPLVLETQALVALIFVAVVLVVKKRAISLSRYILFLVIALGTSFISFHLARNQSQEVQITDALVIPTAVLFLANRQKFVSLLNTSFFSK